MEGKKLRGFAAMSPERVREIASLGGQAVSADRAHMAEIGRMGGVEVAKNPQHMADIGAIGGKASRAKP